jgi:hypothetical protein
MSDKCGVVIPPEAVQGVVMKMPSVEETCRVAGGSTGYRSFRRSFAFVCRHRGEGVTLSDPD